MNYQPTVKNIKKYSDSQGEHVVCRGKIISISNNRTDKFPLDAVDFLIISETEEIKVGDRVLVETELGYKVGEFKKKEKGQYVCVTSSGTGLYYFTSCHKVLALPEHFSDKHLKAILDGKMEEGEVLVKCKSKNLQTNPMDNTNFQQFIHLDQQNHITLFSVKQSLEEAAKEHVNWNSCEINLCPEHSKRVKDFKAGAEWAAKTNYKGE